MNVLFVTATRIGDVVLSTGALNWLAMQHPGARFTIACGRPAASLLAASPGLEGLIVIDKKPLSGHWFGLWAAVVRRWDLAVDLRGSGLTWFLWAARRVVLRRRAEANLIFDRLETRAANRVSLLDGLQRIEDLVDIRFERADGSIRFERHFSKRKIYFSGSTNSLSCHRMCLPEGNTPIDKIMGQVRCHHGRVDRLLHALRLDCYGFQGPGQDRQNCKQGISRLEHGGFILLQVLVIGGGQPFERGE